MIIVDQKLKDKLIDHKLKQLQAQYCQLQIRLAILATRDQNNEQVIIETEEIRALMTAKEKSYAAVEALRDALPKE